MTNEELIEAIRLLLECHEQMEDSRLRGLIGVLADRLMDELRDRAVGLSKRGQE